MPRVSALCLLLPVLLGFDGERARQQLEEVFHNLYGVDVLAGVELVVEDSGTESWIRFAYGRKRSGMETRTLLYMAGVGRDAERALLFQRPGERDRIFVSDGKRGRVRSVSAREYEWGLFGSDFAYEDFRTQRADDYRIEVLGLDRVGDEPCRVLRLRPLQGPYAQLVVWLSVERPVLVRADYFDRKGLWKRYRVDLAELEDHLGWWVPMRDEMLDLRRGRRTSRRIRNILVEAAVPDAMFTTTQLSRLRLPSF